ncbi:MAG: HIT family protein [Gammaproteobacteria bacterium]|nr:HIT family protein [Gammaproteobacteria bacterium]
MFKLDQRLEKDCFVLGKLTLSQLLLMNNAALPWFILVPETTAVEICDLAPDDQAELVTEINMLSILVQGFEGVEKLNIGAIGNIVNQLHVHIVGRYPGDYCWPGVVWGRETPQRYSQEGVDRILSSVRSVLGERLTPA